MTLPFQPYQYDPTWYRAKYALGAQRLHRALPGSALDQGAPRRRFTSRTDDLLDQRWPAEPRALRDPGEPLDAVAADAQEVFDVARTALHRAGWRWVGRRAPWYVWLRPRRSPARDRDLADFLEAVVEPAAFVLVLSTRVARESPPDAIARVARGIPPPGASRPLNRRALTRRFRSMPREEWEARYLHQLITRPAPANAFSRALGVLGVARLRRRREPSSRALYNAACLLARMSTGDESIVTNAAVQLRRAIQRVPPGPRRERLVAWARRDPGLEGLRDAMPGAVEDAIRGAGLEP